MCSKTIKVADLTGIVLSWAYDYAEEQPIYIHFDVEDENYETEEDAKRTYVARKFGDTIEIPEDILNDLQ